MATAAPTITITAPDGTQVPVLVFAAPTTVDEAIPAAEFFSQQLSAPASEPSSPTIPSF
ncbi:hypothetical protein FPSE_06103, partial [Fusarium pseudograminearum CS3096]